LNGKIKVKENAMLITRLLAFTAFGALGFAAHRVFFAQQPAEQLPLAEGVVGSNASPANLADHTGVGAAEPLETSTASRISSDPAPTAAGQPADAFSKGAIQRDLSVGDVS
jgi:hypothetical protein